MKIFAIMNQKGGVGKTTTAVNLAAAMGLRGQRTLLIDMDPQGNTTSGMGVDKRSVEKSSAELMLHNSPAESAILRGLFENLDLIPSDSLLAGLDLKLSNEDGSETLLKRALTGVGCDYDCIFIDCPPSLNLITANVLCASDFVIAPIQCEFYALEGLSQLIAAVKRVKRALNPRLELAGILLTMYDRRLRLTTQVEDEVKIYFPGKVFENVIVRSVRFSEAPSYGKPVVYFDRNCKGAQCYINLAQELDEKICGDGRGEENGK